MEHEYDGNHDSHIAIFDDQEALILRKRFTF